MNKKMGIIERAGYCSLEVGLQFVWTMISTYLAVFYTDVVGLTPFVASAIMLVARIWDGVNDPMMGVIAEKTNTRFGKYRPYLIFAAPILALTSILTLSKTGASGGAAIAYAAVTYILCGMSYTAVSISQGSIVNVMTRDSQTRVQLNALRQMGSGITGLILGAIAMPMILYFGHGSTSSASGYLYTNIIFAVIGMSCILFGGLVCKERVRVQKTASTPTLRESFLYVIKNRNVLLLAVNGIFTAGSILGRMGVLSYYFIYYVGNAEMMASVLMCYNLFTILVQFIVPFLTKRWNKKVVCLMSYALQAISLLIVFFAGPHGIAMIYIGSILMGISNFAPAVLYSINGELADREEVHTGTRSDGIMYSMLGLGTKIGIAVGGAISTALLGVIGYVPNSAQSASTLTGLNILTNLAPIVFVILAALCVGLIDMTNKEAAKNREILEARQTH